MSRNFRLLASKWPGRVTGLQNYLIFLTHLSFCRYSGSQNSLDEMLDGGPLGTGARELWILGFTVPLA